MKKIELSGGEYLKGIWLIEDHGDGRWVWACTTRLDNDVVGYLFIKITDFADAVGHKDAREAGFYWTAELCLVVPSLVSEEGKKSALTSCGYSVEKEEGWINDYGLACILLSYGTSARLWDGCGGSVPKEKEKWQQRNKHDPAFMRLRKEARLAAEALPEGKALDEYLKANVQNDLGMTAWEALRGTEGHWDAFRRINENPSGSTDAQRLVLKMYKNTGNTLGAGPVPLDIMLPAPSEPHTVSEPVRQGETVAVESAVVAERLGLEDFEVVASVAITITEKV
jgi:hypothetical protein